MLDAELGFGLLQTGVGRLVEALVVDAADVGDLAGGDVGGRRLAADRSVGRHGCVSGGGLFVATAGGDEEE